METEDLKTHNDLEASFIKYNRLVYRYIFLFFYSKEVAEDLTQEVFIRAWRYRLSYNPTKSSLKTWLITITRSQCFDYYKKEKHFTTLIQEPSETINSLEKSVTKELLNEYIYSKIKSLSDLDKDLIILRFYNELDIEEISKIINKTYDATKVAINRAFNRLKEIINNENK